MHPLVRWQFRGGIEEKDRKAFLFTNVIDSKGRKYDIPVLVGGLAANREIYRIGMGCPFEEIDERWVARGAASRSRRVSSRTRLATRSSSPARRSTSPGTASTAFRCRSRRPGWDIAPYATLSQYITTDPDTGVQNMGNYRGQVKARRRLGMNPSLELRPGIYNHWEKLRARGFKKLPMRGGARRAALHHLRVGAEAAGDAGRDFTSPARWSARRSTSSRRRPSTSWCRPRPRS